MNVPVHCNNVFMQVLCLCTIQWFILPFCACLVVAVCLGASVSVCVCTYFFSCVLCTLKFPSCNLKAVCIQSEFFSCLLCTILYCSCKAVVPQIIYATGNNKLQVFASLDMKQWKFKKYSRKNEVILGQMFI